MADVSILTVALSAGVSVVTGYELQEQGGDEAQYRQQLADHLRLLRAAQRRTLQTVHTLRRETPTDLDERLRYCRRRSSLALRRLRLRLRAAGRVLPRAN